MPPILNDIGLHHAHSGPDQIGETRKCVGLVASRNRDVEVPRNLTHRFDMIMLHRLLKPPVAEFFENPPTRTAPTE